METLEAGFWGFVGNASLLIGAFIGLYAGVAQRVIAIVMAAGAGVLVSSVAFELMMEAYEMGGFYAASSGILLGGMAFFAADSGRCAMRGRKDRKRSGGQQAGGSSTAITIGAIMDGIPESVAIGVSLIEGGAVGAMALLVARTTGGRGTHQHPRRNRGRVCPYTAQPHTFVLWLDLTIHKIYDGWFFVGRPTLEELRHDLRQIMQSRSDYRYEAYITPRVKSIRIPQQEWTGGTRPLGTSCLPVERGAVRWFDIEAGVGTITSESSDEEVFFHFTVIPGEGYRTMTPGKVERFEVVEGSADSTARNVQKEGS